MIVEPPLYPPGFTPAVRITTQEINTTATEEVTPSKKSLMIDVVQTTTSTTQDINKNFLTPTTASSESLSSPASEKVLRRSVNDFFNKVIGGNSSNVVMKIMDRYGQPRIEIKINTDYSSETKGSFKFGSDLEMIVQKDNARSERGDLGYNTEIKILPNDTVIIDSKNNYLLSSDGVTRDTIEKKPKTANESGTATIPISENNMTYVNNNKNQISKDKLKTKSMFKPTITVEKKLVKESNAIKGTIFPDLKNSMNLRVASISKINNDTTESILQSQIKDKTDAIENINNANLRIVKGAENESSTFPIGKNNISIGTEKFSNVHKSIVLNKEPTTTSSTSPTSSSSAPTKITHSYELKVRFEKK